MKAVRIALAAVATACVGMLALFAVNLALTLVPTDHYQNVVDEAVRSGTLAAQHHQLFGPRKPIYRYGYNDCLMLGMSMMPRESRLKAAVSPRMAVPADAQSPDQSIKAPLPPGCGFITATLGALARGEVDERRPEPDHYHRYIHGDATVVALLLAVMSVAAASLTMLGLCYVVLLAILLSALGRLRDADPAERARALAFVVIAAVLMTCYGVAAFDHAYSFGPTDAVIFGFILIGFWRPLGQMSERAFVVLAAGFGTLIAILEFLTGGIPMGLAVLIALVALGKAIDRRALLRRLTAGVAAFAIAGVTCVVIKLVAVLLVWGTNELGTFVTAGGVHAVGAVTSRLSPEALTTLSSYGIDPQWIDTNHVTRIVFAGMMLTYSAFLIGWGSHIIGAAIVLLPAPALVGFAYLAVRRRKVADWPADRLALIAAGWVPVAWYVALPNHTIFHSSFMVRPLAITLALAIIVGPLFDRLAAWTTMLQAKRFRQS